VIRVLNAEIPIEGGEDICSVDMEACRKEITSHSNDPQNPDEEKSQKRGRGGIDALTEDGHD